jgi:predicted  nucleic acid-binding Zn-ribbon protein
MSVASELRRLQEEVSHCPECGHYQGEPDWCHRCRHRVDLPDWASELLGELDASRLEVDGLRERIDRLRETLVDPVDAATGEGRR